ncbi:hypothetical protein [Cohnella silvisoli]|uniref:Uncharacterized protein n=1 Tax=Cohnella silvisoli TaxID=2873699 RepID=A0ABV1KMC2_9BACL|nr:hypothetical protein [Cohnella silvisoli]
MLMKLLGDLGTAVELTGLIVDSLDLIGPFSELTGSISFGAILPFVVSATRNLEHAAHLLQSVLGAVFAVERREEVHRFFLDFVLLLQITYLLLQFPELMIVGLKSL